MSNAPIENGPYQPAPPPPVYSDASQGDNTGGLIPYKNPQALIAYYLGIVALLPFIGLVFGIAAFILGILGLRARKRNPVIKGSVHAWIGIVLGGGSAFLWGSLILLGIVGLVIGRAQ